MVDEIFDRHYQAGRNELNGAIFELVSRLGKASANAFAVLNRIEYSEPWIATPKRTHCN